MQFNFVISTNARAVKLWCSLGFAVVGPLPKAFAPPRWGLVGAFVMYSELEASSRAFGVPSAFAPGLPNIQDVTHRPCAG